MRKFIRALVVDDSPLGRQAICSAVAELPNFQIVGFARNGYEAVEQIGLLRPDLLLMDMRMPEMNRLEATERVRQLFPDTRVIIVTADDTAEARRAAQVGGMDGFVCKYELYQQLCFEVWQVLRDTTGVPRLACKAMSSQS